MFPISHFNITRTPFYYYDKTLLSNTLAKLIRLAGERNYHVHYAVKANANPEILKLIAASGIGADCVSGGRVSCKKNCICRGWKGRLGNRICP